MVEVEIEEWITAANDCTYINFNRAGEDVFEECFQPVFTYPVFGDDERILGYKEPVIDLRFRSHDLQPHVAISYKGKISPPTKEIAEQMDLDSQLKEFIPDSAWIGSGLIAQDPHAASWKPPGEKLHAYMANGNHFEIWCAKLTESRAKDILANMRIFISFYIEGGTCNFLDDPPWSLERWKIFFLYQVFQDTKKNASPYSLAGFSTSYRNWVISSSEVLAAFHGTSPADCDLSRTSFLSDASEDGLQHAQSENSSFDPEHAPSRERISQFLILPPYQHQSHGTHLYNTMTKLFLDDPYVFEITVEDPNEAFDDLRDYCDLARLVPDSDFATLRLATELDNTLLAPDCKIPRAKLVDVAAAEKVWHKHKLGRRQFHRLLEIHLLSTIEPRHRSVNRITRKSQASDLQDRQYYFWRLWAKARLFWQNKDTLMQLDAEERIPKLEETLTGLQEDYERLLAGFERRKKYGLAAVGVGKPVNGEASSEMLSVRNKRKVVDDDDSTDSDEDGSRTPLKKVKA